MVVVKDESVVNIIRSKINDYDKMLSDIMNSEKPDHKLAGKYRYYIMCLDELNKELFGREHAIFETLKQNYKKWDTKFIFLDDSSYTLDKEEICVFQDNFVLIMDDNEFKENKSLVTKKAINLDNVKVVETLS